jgi:predicted MFS family arabinose efflux permease
VGIRVLLLLAAGLVLADASVVTLALPPIIAELDASVEQAAAVLGVYTAVLAVALPLVTRLPPRRLALGGAVVFALASAGCGLADTVTALLVLRGAQALGGAALLVGAFTLVEAAGAGRRAWTAVAIFGFAAGPALGGALTQAFDWRAIFLAQVPLALAAAASAAFVSRSRTSPALDAEPASFNARGSLGPIIALALLSAALVGVLFLLVLLLITGWSVTPLAAAAAVTVLPVAAVIAARVHGPPRVRAASGALLVAGGVLTLALLPGASLWWTVLPQAMAGAGLGLALPALAGDLLPEDTAEQAANLLAIRQAGITVALILLAPVAAAQLDEAVSDTRLKGAALVLDAKLPPLDKLSLAGTLLADIDPVDPRGQLEAGLEQAEVDPEDRAAFDELGTRADEMLVAGVQAAFAPAFAICGVLALLAALVVLPADRRVLAAGAAALVLAGGAALAKPELEPEPVVLADPCQDRELPATGGVEGAIQDVALVALDRAACRFGSSREELALALVDADARADYEREYGVDPRSIGGLLSGILDF